eukprot:c11405_g1_i1 orf=511-1359(-)
MASNCLFLHSHSVCCSFLSAMPPPLHVHKDRILLASLSSPRQFLRNPGHTRLEQHWGRRIVLEGALAFFLSKSANAFEESHGNALVSPSRDVLAAFPVSQNSLASSSSSSVGKGFIDTGSWYRFQGKGFEISVPPHFEDILEPEVFSSGSSLYGERAKPKSFVARFASPDRSEILSVVIRPASQLKLSFFETKDITDIGSIKEAANIFVPAGAKLCVAHTIKSADSPRTYYFFEFLSQQTHIAMEAAASGGKVFVVGAIAPQSKWKDDGKMLRSAAFSFSVN